MMKKTWIIGFLLFVAFQGYTQRFEVGVETSIGRSHATFKGDLAKMVGFSELEISRAQVDTAFAHFGLGAPRWLKDLFPGIKIDVNTTLSKQLTRNITSTRFFARYDWLGGSFTISDPRLTPQLESKKFGNQFKSVRLSLSGDAEALAEHLAIIALKDETKVKPFFSKRYDLEAYVDVKKLVFPHQALLEWGKNSTLDLELTVGFRFTADPSPVVDLGSILFVSEKIDELMEGGILNPVENTTDQIAVAIQNVVFGKFRDPRVVPSLGWIVRGELPVYFGWNFSLVAGGEFGINKHTSIKGTSPMYSAYGFAGLRWRILGVEKK